MDTYIFLYGQEDYLIYTLTPCLDDWLSTVPRNYSILGPTSLTCKMEVRSRGSTQLVADGKTEDPNSTSLYTHS